MVLLRWLSSWFLISKRNIEVHQKDTLALAIHSSCLKALSDGGCLRLNQVLSREFKVKSPPPPLTSSTPPAFIGQWASNITRIWHDKLKAHMTSALTLPAQSKTNGRYQAFAVPFPPRDWHGGPFPTHGELPQGLSLTMRPTRTASPLCFFSPQWPVTWLSPGSCANILARFEVCFQKFG